MEQKSAQYDKDTSEMLEYLEGLGSVVLAYSGGVDSTLLLHLLKLAGTGKVVAITSAAETYNPRDAHTAAAHAGQLGIEHVIIRTSELESEDFRKNGPRRCYYCKHELFSRLKGLAREKDCRYVLDASHSDDSSDYRPGMTAAGELGVISPFLKFGWDKGRIRDVSKDMGIDGWDRPSTVCLASRFSYGTPIDAGKLEMVGISEEFLRESGLRQIRVRTDGLTARIEVDERDIPKLSEHGLRKKIVEKFLETGFKYVCLDLEGYVSGKMNRVLDDGR
jgi:uncharacterized protein